MYDQQYQAKRHQRISLSPNRGGDAFLDDKTPMVSYRDIMLSQELLKEELAVKKAIAEKKAASKVRTFL